MTYHFESHSHSPDDVIIELNKIENKEVVESIDLYGFEFTEAQAAQLAEALARFPNLKKLDLSFSLKAGAITIASQLPTTIEYLDLMECGIEVENLEGLGKALKALKNLQHLDLSDNKLGAGAITIINHLPATIDSLELEKCGIEAEHLDCLGGALNTLHNLKNLVLSQNKLGAGVTTIINHLPATITALELEKCGIEAEHSDVLGEALNTLHNLKNLVLTDNKLGAGAITIASQLPTTIEFLDLAQCEIEDEHVEGLGGALKALHNLKKLNLWWNRISDDSEKLKTFLVKCIKLVDFRGPVKNHTKGMLRVQEYSNKPGLEYLDELRENYRDGTISNPDLIALQVRLQFVIENFNCDILHLLKQELHQLNRDIIHTAGFWFSYNALCKPKSSVTDVAHPYGLPDEIWYAIREKLNHIIVPMNYVPGMSKAVAAAVSALPENAEGVVVSGSVSVQAKSPAMEPPLAVRYL